MSGLSRRRAPSRGFIGDRQGLWATWVRLKRTVKRRYKRQRADVLVVSHAKSGRTWLAAMISHVYSRRYGLPNDELLQFDSFHQLDRRVPRILFTHDNRKDGAHTPLFTSMELGQQKVVLLVRHPCDIAVSAYFQSLRDGRKGFGPDHGGEPIFDYVMAVKLPQVLAFLSRWRDQLPALQHSLLLRYEDLHAQPRIELERVMRFIDGQADAAEIDAAVAFGSFEHMQRREADGSFASDKLRPGDPKDPRSFKVREGKVGGYRSHFSEAELAQIDAMVAATDLSGFGYVAGGLVVERAL